MRFIMAVVIKVVNGKIQEYENGNYKRTYGSNIVAADTDGHIVAAVTAKVKWKNIRMVFIKEPTRK